MKPVPVLLPKRILLVDDNADGLLVRRQILEELGYLVEVAKNGEEGLKLFNKGPFDLVVSDYRMPRMNGLELIEKIRVANPNARIILLSGFAEAMGLNEENTGADAVIAKSAAEATQLVRWIKRLLNRETLRKPPAAQRSVSSHARRTNLSNWK